MAEEQLGALNDYMAKATNAYQTEIMRLRKALSASAKAQSPQGGKLAKASAPRPAASPQTDMFDSNGQLRGLDAVHARK